MNHYNMPMRPTLLTTAERKPTLTERAARGIRREMSSQHINRADMARLTGIAYTRMLSIWHGRRAITIDELFKVSEVLGVRIDQLLPEDSHA